MSFEAIVDDAQWPMHDGHPTITNAHLEPMVRSTKMHAKLPSIQKITTKKMCDALDSGEKAHLMNHTS